MNNELSPTMQGAVNYAMKHSSGRLYRFPGGYWCISSERRTYPSWGASTIEGIVKRGFAEYSDWVEGRSGKFPVEVTFKSKSEGR